MEWISVEYKKPEEGKNVLLFIVYQRMLGGSHYEDYIIVPGGIKDGDWYVRNGMMLWDYDFNIGFTDYDITHWMPLPEQPKE